MERLNKSIIGNSGFLPEDPSSTRTSDIGYSARSSNIKPRNEETKEKANNLVSEKKDPQKSASSRIKRLFKK